MLKFHNPTMLEGRLENSTSNDVISPEIFKPQRRSKESRLYLGITLSWSHKERNQKRNGRWISLPLVRVDNKK